MAYTIRTPDGKGYQMEGPEEGKLFKNIAGEVGMIKGGQYYKISPEQELANKYNLGSIASTGDSPAIAWNNWLRSQGLTTGGAVQERAYKELGIDLTKLPEYNTADLYQYGVFTGTPQSLSGADAKSGYDMGAFAKAATTPTELTGNAIPKEISGANGPVDAQGNPIASADYAKYGITDTKPAAPVTYVNGVAQPAAGGKTNPLGLVLPNQFTPEEKAAITKYGFDPNQGMDRNQLNGLLSGNLQQAGLAPGASGEAPQTGTQPQYQILNVEAMGKYKPTDYERLPDGRVVLKPGVQPIEGTVKTATGQTPAAPTETAAQYQILDLEAMKKYTPDQYERLPDGRVVLKPGVQPIEGTVKQVGATPGQLGAPGQTGEEIVGADGTAAGTVDTGTGMPSTTADFYTKQNEENQKFYTDMLDKITAQQKEFLDAYTNQPSMVDELKRLREEQGLPQLEKEIALIDRQILDTEGLLDTLEADINKRIQGMPVSESARRRMLALEGKPLSEQLNQLIRGRTRLGAGLSSKEQVISQMMNLKASEQDKAINAEKMKLDFGSQNLDFAAKLFSSEQENKEKAYMSYLDEVNAKIAADNKSSEAEKEMMLEIAKEEKMKELGLGRYATDDKIPTDIITAGGRQLLVNTQTGETIKDLGAVTKTGGGGGGTSSATLKNPEVFRNSKDETAFWTEVDQAKNELQSGEIWGNVWDRLKLQFPNVPNDFIDKALGTSWSKEGAYQEWTAGKKGDTGREA